MKAKNKPHYVDNKKFLQAMIEYRDKCKKAEEKNRNAGAKIRTFEVRRAGVSIVFKPRSWARVCFHPLWNWGEDERLHESMQAAFLREEQ